MISEVQNVSVYFNRSEYSLKKQSPEMFFKKGVLKKFTKLAEKHLCCGFFLSKVAGLRLAVLLKKRLWHRCFPVNFAKFFKIAFLQNTSCGCFYGNECFVIWKTCNCKIIEIGEIRLTSLIASICN